MPNTSTIQQQALDIGYVVMQSCQNGANQGQVENGLDALASALMMLATCLNLLTNNTTTVGVTLAATYATGTKFTPGGTGWSQNPTNVPSNYVGTGGDPVTFASILNGTVPIAPAAP